MYEKEMSSPYDGCVLYLLLGSSSLTFDLEKAVCSHGFFMMAPNHWDPATKTLQRPFRLFSSSSTTTVVVRIYQPSNDSSNLHVQVVGTHFISSQDKQVLLAQVSRMLRVSEKEENDISEFHEIHPGAKIVGFGRIFRSPTLFEDIVKSILLCNCGWGRSLDMARALCDVQLELKGFKQKAKRKRGAAETSSLGDFPTSKELANVKKEFLEKRCNLGYRAETIVRLVRSIESGELHFEDDQDYNTVTIMLESVKGIGSFTSSYVLTCMGFYQRIPADTETIRHIKQVHAREICSAKTVNKDANEIYKKYAPFQYLAYWYVSYHLLIS
ncbi:hypothetical protein IFM89_036466 [Coptis chinensis]|uniref:HhH-GPD domain-containing protein n=1 Tax=Coptis chinensis TaxID=261450 RepID=A0A835MBL4_9MAGN|nr:hypothetical protein IFM89_036466 [Coptis chinensis]